MAERSRASRDLAFRQTRVILRQEMGPLGGLRAQTSADSRRVVLPSFFAASCKTLFSRRLRAAFLNRAGQVVRYRNQHQRADKTSSPARNARGFRRHHHRSSSWSSSGPSSSLTVDWARILRPRQADYINCFRCRRREQLMMSFAWECVVSAKCFGARISAINLYA